MTAAAYLDAHGDGVPDSLHARMLAAARGHAGERVDHALSDAALAELREMLKAPSARSAALGLLAADALLTSAFESVASDGEALAALARRLEPARLAALLDA